MDNNSLTIIIVSLFSVALGSGELDTADYDSDCPVWTYRHNSTSPCQCGSTVNGRIGCNLTSGLLSLRLCFCLTYDNSTSDSVAGYCPYSCATYPDKPVHDVHMDKASFSDMCEVWKREGPLCSRCQPNNGIPLYTYYSMTCVECPHFQLNNLITFLIMSLVPTTVLFILVMILHLHVIHPPWSVFVLVAQAMSVRFLLQISYGAHHKYERFVTTSDTLLGTIFGPWNLDFFRALYPAECISPDITNLQSYAIDGVIGLYPLLMLALLYALVALRDCGCKLALNIHYLLSRFRSCFNLQSSLIGTFATFYLLSYMKIAISGLQILSPTRMWMPNGTHVWVVYSDPSVAYFSSTHIAYAVVTLMLALLVVILLFCCFSTHSHGSRNFFTTLT